jgi:hypothetical protein
MPRPITKPSPQLQNVDVDIILRTNDMSLHGFGAQLGACFYSVHNDRVFVNISNCSS